MPDSARHDTAARAMAQTVDCVIVGAGFAGLYMLYEARRHGFSTRVFEMGSDVGGTWFWNRYPGARCDVESLEYSYSFDPTLEQEWEWSERFATQPEILRYLNHVADRFDLRGDITFDTMVEGADFDAATDRWLVRASNGEHIAARFVIMATGCLSDSRVPDFPGLADYRGEVYHTGRWPHDTVDFTGKTVGVIGTGSSGIQTIPEVAKQADHLFVFQRTPSFSVPARNAPLDAEAVAQWKQSYPEKRRRAREEMRSGWLVEPPIGEARSTDPDVREREYTRRWQKGGANFLYAFSDLGVDEEANRTAADFVRARIADIVTDPALAAKLTPNSYPIGTKRICVDTDYYATFNRDNVTLVDLREAPITSFTPDGIRTEAETYPLDAVVLATGFDAITGALTRIDLTGADGARLTEKWDAGPTNYLGLMTTNFPNFFMITGPGSPSVLSNVVLSIEQHVQWLSALLQDMRTRGVTRVEPTQDAEAEWVDYCRRLAEGTLQMRSDSWYLGANVPGKPRVFMPFIGGTNLYRRICDEVAADGYRGFRFSAAGQ